MPKAIQGFVDDWRSTLHPWRTKVSPYRRRMRPLQRHRRLFSQQYVLP